MFRVAAEHVRVAEARILLGDAPPHVPAAAGPEFRSPCGSRGLRTHGGILHATAVGDEHQIVLGQIDVDGFAVGSGDIDTCGLLAGLRTERVAREHAGLCLCEEDLVLPYTGVPTYRPIATADGELHVLHLRVVVELHVMAFQVGDHRQNHRLVLVVAGESQRAEVRQASDVVDVALDVQFHLQSAVPVLEGEHGAPIEPEVGIEHLVVEEVGDFLAIQFLVGGEEQLHDLLRGFVRQFEFAVGTGVLALIDGGAA